MPSTALREIALLKAWHCVRSGILTKWNINKVFIGFLFLCFCVWVFVCVSIFVCLAPGCSLLVRYCTTSIVHHEEGVGIYVFKRASAEGKCESRVCRLGFRS